MLAQFGNFRLTGEEALEPPSSMQLVFPVAGHFGGETYIYKFYETGSDTFVLLYFREFSWTLRVVTLAHEPVEHLSDKDKETVGGGAVAHFAEHIQQEGKPPKDLTYGPE